MKNRTIIITALSVGFLVQHHVMKVASFSAAPVVSSCQTLLPDHVVKQIKSAEVAELVGWLPKDRVAELRKQVLKIHKDGHFHPSGLRVSTNDNFGTQDRQICDQIHDEYLTPELLELGERIDTLRCNLARSLDRWSMEEDDLEHECYISYGPPGSSLGRHLDERHEELRPSNRWSFFSRRSISWLLFLNDERWDSCHNGGELELYVPQKGVIGKCGCHNGNLQVGWLVEQNASLPVYMTSSHQAAHYINSYDDGNDSYYQSRLYILTNHPDNLKLTVISQAFVVDHGIQNFSFFKMCLENIYPGYRDQFIPLELLEAEKSLPDVDVRSSTVPYESFNSEVYDSYFSTRIITPRGGTLVLFDSVCLSHRVRQTLQGNRLAIAGWFHEKVVEPKTTKSLLE